MCLCATVLTLSTGISKYEYWQVFAVCDETIEVVCQCGNRIMSHGWPSLCVYVCVCVCVCARARELDCAQISTGSITVGKRFSKEKGGECNRVTKNRWPLSFF